MVDQAWPHSAQPRKLAVSFSPGEAPPLPCCSRLGFSKGNTVAAGGGPWGREQKAVMARKAPGNGMHVGVLATCTPHQSWFLEEAPG